MSTFPSDASPPCLPDALEPARPTEKEGKQLFATASGECAIRFFDHVSDEKRMVITQIIAALVETRGELARRGDADQSWIRAAELLTLAGDRREVPCELPRGHTPRA